MVGVSAWGGESKLRHRYPYVRFLQVTMHAYIHIYIHMITYYAHTLIYPFTHPLTRPLTHSLTRSPTHPPTHSLTHSQVLPSWRRFGIATALMKTLHNHCMAHGAR